MKKLFLFSAIFALMNLAAYQVVEIPSPVSGEGFTSPAGGKIVAVQAFSTSASGTVALNSVYEAPVFTNAVQIIPATSTNYTVVASNRVANAVGTNVLDAATFGEYTAAKWNTQRPLESVLSVATNIVTTATTNTWPVYQKSVSVTNSIVSGTCSSNLFSASPESDTYIKPNERLLFTGTATGGFIRLILE